MKIYHYSGLMDQNQFSQEIQLIGTAFFRQIGLGRGRVLLDEEVVNPEPVVFTTISLSLAVIPIILVMLPFFKAHLVLLKSSI